MPDESLELPVACRRCGKELTPGSGNLYQITIEALSDPSPPRLDELHGRFDLNQSFRDVLDDLEDLSATEAMDQVYRRMSFFLCVRCYALWIEDPTGTPDR
ncbi:hypothetical protein JCM19992_26140 [Thermostilla marina]